MNLDLYRKIPEVDQSTSPEDIRRSYRDPAEIRHPDRFSHNPGLREIADGKPKEVKDKRNYIRKHCHIVTDYIVQNRPFTPYKNTIQNISGSGIFIETEKPFSKGQHLFLSFILPYFGELSSISGDIVRVTPVGIGVSFSISDRYRKLISNVI